MNSITVAGIIGQDAKIIPSQSGEGGISFSIADSQGKDKPTIWWNATLWGKRWDSIQQYLVKGTKITVSGSLQLKGSTKGNGEGSNFTNLIVNNIALQGTPLGHTDHGPSQAFAKGELPKKVDSLDDIPF